MADNTTLTTDASKEQVLYANILNKGMLIGLAILLITFALYVFGVMKPFIPVTELSSYWHMSAHDYLQTLKIPDGWGWITMLKFGDFLNFIGIAFLSAVTIICYAAIVPILFKNNDKVYGTLAILEVLVLTLAATGILSAGH